MNFRFLDSSNALKEGNVTKVSIGFIETKIRLHVIVRSKISTNQRIGDLTNDEDEANSELRS